MRVHRNRGNLISVMLVSIVAFVGSGALPAHAAFPTVAWPTSKGWGNPLVPGAGSFMMTTKWGGLSKGCRNADLTNGGTYYLDPPNTTAHLGLDLNRGDGQAVYAIADGVVKSSGTSWGADNRTIVVVEHSSSLGDKFLGVNGDLYSDAVRTGTTVRKGDQIGRVQNAGTGPHLHFGIRPGAWAGTVPRGSVASSVDGNKNCTFDSLGTVDPIGYLSSRSPAGMWPTLNIRPKTIFPTTTVKIVPKTPVKIVPTTTVKTVAPPRWNETTGSTANTWTNYVNAGGTQGPTIGKNVTVQVSCRLTGFRVSDGNTWWYRIASSPWNDVYYVSADAFYNNGATSGSLKGTPFVDTSVRIC